jgi:hypothetical protein
MKLKQGVLERKSTSSLRTTSNVRKRKTRKKELSRNTPRSAN